MDHVVLVLFAEMSFIYLILDLTEQCNNATIVFRCDSISRNTLYTGHLLTYLLTYSLSHRVEVTFQVRYPGLSDKSTHQWRSLHTSQALQTLGYYSHYGITAIVAIMAMESHFDQYSYDSNYIT